MKKIFVIAIILFATFIYGNCVCSKASTRYYHGHIYTIEREPISNIRLYHYGNLKGITDENGYFKIEATPNIAYSILVMEIDGEIIDSVQIMSY